ncbi:hypothetical protein AKO1_002928 [Acrasis kona]|uniref:Uncharacterized protein n=1 Tax=Acrasis kona TaxID=1008807 RepID=A0AAW2Z679_9EUKA
MLSQPTNHTNIQQAQQSNVVPIQNMNCPMTSWAPVIQTNLAPPLMSLAPHSQPTVQVQNTTSNNPSDAIQVHPQPVVQVQTHPQPVPSQNITQVTKLSNEQNASMTEKAPSTKTSPAVGSSSTVRFTLFVHTTNICKQKKPTITRRKARTSLEDVVRNSLDKAEPLQKITETTAQDDQRTNLVDKNILEQKMPLKRMDIAPESSSTTLVGQAPTITSPDVTSLEERIKDLEEWRKKVEGTMQQVKEEVKVEDCSYYNPNGLEDDE